MYFCSPTDPDDYRTFQHLLLLVQLDMSNTNHFYHMHSRKKVGVASWCSLPLAS
jgi:hypothetical protein